FPSPSRGGPGLGWCSTRKHLSSRECRQIHTIPSQPSLEGRALVARPMREDVCPDASRQSGGSTPLPCVVVRVAACPEVLRTAVRVRGNDIVVQTSAGRLLPPRAGEGWDGGARCRRACVAVALPANMAHPGQGAPMSTPRRDPYPDALRAG